MKTQTCFFLIFTRAQVQRAEFNRATALRLGQPESQTIKEFPKQVHFQTLCVPNVGEELDAFADDRRIRLRVKGRRWQFDESAPGAKEAMIFLDTEILTDEPRTAANDIWLR